MPDPPDLPEASDSFSKIVALSIAVMAVALAIISTIGDNAKSGSLLAATQASNQWAYYQAKSIKEHSYSIQREILELMAGPSVDETKRKALLDRYEKEVARYKDEKEKIEADARSFTKEIEENSRVNDRCDLAGIFLQIGIVLASVAILIKWKPFWVISLILAVAGIAAACGAFDRWLFA